ncbi:MAG: hypothetical protein JWQ42_1639 [Edaphobacter sp.]|nr:hypothetical protein [Edaphobacter sp.]
MKQNCLFLKSLAAIILVAALLVFHVPASAQTKPVTMPDAQIEANVLKALAGAPQLTDQAISSTTVFGTVTLSGTARDEASRDMAEALVSNAPGVKKVVDELTIGTGTAAAAVADGAQQGQDSTGEGTSPNLHSDGTMAPPSTQMAPAQSSPNAAGPQQQQADGQQEGQQPPYRRGFQRPYGSPPSAYEQQQPQVVQQGGTAVVVPSGSMFRVRIDEGMSSKKTAPGTLFDGVMLNDVVAGGSIAIPRGAAVQGVVADVHNSGQLKGSGGLSLQLTQVTLGGRTYPLVSNLWSYQGVDKTGSTVGNTVGLGAVGALIGAVAGGGVGAAVGAGVGGVAGLGVSSASGRGEAILPAEAIVSFRLTQPAELTTVSQAELNRLGAGVPIGGPQQLQRRYPPPPPPPPYYYGYGPVYYPYPRYYR